MNLTKKRKGCRSIPLVTLTDVALVNNVAVAPPPPALPPSYNAEIWLEITAPPSAEIEKFVVDPSNLIELRTQTGQSVYRKTGSDLTIATTTELKAVTNEVVLPVGFVTGTTYKFSALYAYKKDGKILYGKLREDVVI